LRSEEKRRKGENGYEILLGAAAEKLVVRKRG
jgi:hypothetical protein